MIWNETPSDFILLGADMLSPVNKNDVVLIHRNKYMRIFKSGYNNSPVDINIIEQALEILLSSDDGLSDMVDSYIEYAFNKEAPFCPVVCTKRMDWCLNQIRYIHEKDRLLFRDIFSIGIVETNDSIDSPEWKKFVKYMNLKFKDLIKKYPLFEHFHLYDDSTDNDYRILTLECSNIVDWQPEFNKNTTIITTNNPTVINAYRTVSDSYKLFQFNPDSISHMKPHVETHVETFTRIHNCKTAQEVIDMYRTINDNIMGFLNGYEKGAEDDVSIDAYNTFIYSLTDDIEAVNVLKDIEIEDPSLLDDMYCIINTCLMYIKDRYMGQVGLHSEVSTMAIIYRGQLIRNKDLLKQIRRSL